MTPMTVVPAFRWRSTVPCLSGAGGKMDTYRRVRLCDPVRGRRRDRRAGPPADDQARARAGRGLWSIPGGRIEPGETDAEALAREMLEETNLTVEVGPLLGRVQRPFLDGAVIDIRDYAVTVTGGTLRPGDDAADARWVAAADLHHWTLPRALLKPLLNGEFSACNGNFAFFPIFAPEADDLPSSGRDGPRRTSEPPVTGRGTIRGRCPGGAARAYPCGARSCHAVLCARPDQRAAAW